MQTYTSGIEGKRRFTKDGEHYTVTVYWDDQDPNNVGWAYRITSDERGSLDSGELDTDDPWAEIEQMFPEAEAG
jgi:hypothetical protein